MKRRVTMKLKKLGAMFLTAAIVATAMVGCGSKDSGSKTNSGEKSQESTSGDDGEVTTLTFYNADLQEDDPWTDPVALALTEKTGVKLDVDHPVGEDKQKVSLMIAEQNFPDMIYAKGDAGSLIDAGAVEIYAGVKRLEPDCNGSLLQ